jgi:hypothetical protein
MWLDVGRTHVGHKMRLHTKRLLFIGIPACGSGRAFAEQVAKTGCAGPRTISLAHFENDARHALDETKATVKSPDIERARFEYFLEDAAAGPKIAISVAQDLVDKGASNSVRLVKAGAALIVPKTRVNTGIPRISTTPTDSTCTNQRLESAFPAIRDGSIVVRAFAHDMSGTTDYRPVPVVVDRKVCGERNSKCRGRESRSKHQLHR